MKYIISILGDVITLVRRKLSSFLRHLQHKQLKRPAAFRAIVKKEVADYLNSWRIIILLIIILLTCFSSLYTALMTIQDVLAETDEEAKEIVTHSHLFLKLFTVSDGTLPSFITFVTFLGPLLGIALGFDAINSERNSGTLTRLMAQPIPRDYVINGKFIAALLINIGLFLILGLFVTALGILMIGIPPTFGELLRIFTYIGLCIVYIAFWLNLSILFSLLFRQAATSALAGIGIWIFFSVFYSMIVNIIAKGYLSVDDMTSVDEFVIKQGTMLNIMRLSPNYLFTESTSILLSPTVRSLGPLTMEQTAGQIAAPLPLGESLAIIWPQMTGLIAATMICFAISYIVFMRQDIRMN